MATAQIQINSAHHKLGSLAASFSRVVNALGGNQQLLEQYSVAAAHYDGLIDAIERAGWDLSRIEKVKHTFDETVEHLLRELAESLPDMSETEEQSFLTPFRHALHQFARMTVKERLAFRGEYARFTELRTRSLERFAAEEVA